MYVVSGSILVALTIFLLLTVVSTFISLESKRDRVAKYIQNVQVTTLTLSVVTLCTMLYKMELYL